MERVHFGNGWFILSKEHFFTETDQRRRYTVARAKVRANGKLGEIRYCVQDGSAGMIDRAFRAWVLAGRPISFEYQD